MGAEAFSGQYAPHVQFWQTTAPELLNECRGQGFGSSHVLSQ
jgi:hypothetical protein